MSVYMFQFIFKRFFETRYYCDLIILCCFSPPYSSPHDSAVPSEEEAESTEAEVSVPAEESAAAGIKEDESGKTHQGKSQPAKQSAKPQKPQQGKGQPGKTAAKANGVPVKPTDEKRQGSPKKKKDKPSGPKKAKIAKLDGEAVKKGDKVKKEKVIQEGGVTKTEAGAEKKEGSRFEKKIMKKKHKSPLKKKNRIGKNKFKKLKKLLTKDDSLL